MIIQNTKCRCHLCIKQWRCEDHKLAVRFQTLLNSLGSDDVKLQMWISSCDNFEGAK